MRWLGHVAPAGERRGAREFGWGSLKGTDHLENLGVNGDSIKINIKETGCDCDSWIHLAQDESGGQL